MAVILQALAFWAMLALSLALDQRQTFIIRVENDLKPLDFPSVENWYSSTLKSLVSTDSLSGSEERAGAASIDHPPLDFLHVYKTVFHGFSARLTDTEAEELKSRHGILGVFPDRAYLLHTTRSPEFMGLTPESPLLKESDGGSGVIIGILDSGIWPERRSFHDEDLGPVPAGWKGECEEGPNFTKANCNKKIIGARFFPKGYEAARGPDADGFRSPRDSQGHGTHTASTAAGRLVQNVSLEGYAGGNAVGIAPKARIAAYKVCWATGCMGSDVLEGIDKAVEDGVDIISLSLGGSSPSYSLDPIAMGAFGAIEKNVFVSASAGNSGPLPKLVTNTAPWITTVGAGTIDRSFPASLLLGNGQVMAGVSIYPSGNFPAGQFFPVVYFGSSSAGTGDHGLFPGAVCMQLKPEEVRGKIVICDRGGGISRVEKGAAVKEAGGVGMILANVAPEGYGVTADPHVLPAVSIGEKDGYDVRGYYFKNRVNARAAFVFHGTQVGVRPAPLVAAFSSRGPALECPYIVKPDLVAPGANILAAWPDGVAPTNLKSDARRTEFNIMSGTSMACPHVSGLAALLKGSHPAWSPASIRSALMTTAYAEDKEGKPVVDESNRNASKVWDVGSGHVDPERALVPGLVYDLTSQDYVQFLCDSNYTEKTMKAIARRPASCTGKKGNPWDLNYPSISVVIVEKQGGVAALEEITVRRVATNVREDGPASYVAEIRNPEGATVVVEPAKLNFSKREEKLEFMVRIKAERVELSPGTMRSASGMLAWMDGKYVVRSPIAVTWSRESPGSGGH